MSLKSIRQVAKDMSLKLDKSEQELIDMGANPVAIKIFIQSRQELLNGIIGTNPPPELAALIKDEEKQKGV